MNQLNQIQEKLQSNLISNQELKALKGKRGRIFKGNFGMDTSGNSGGFPVKPSPTTTSTASSPTVTTSTQQTVTADKFLKVR